MTTPNISTSTPTPPPPPTQPFLLPQAQKRKADSPEPTHQQPLSPSKSNPAAASQPPSSPPTPKTPPTATITRTLHPQWTYLHLTPLTSTTTTTTPPPTLDAPTLRLHLLSALTTHLGLHGSAIPIDILAIHPPSPTNPISELDQQPEKDARNSGSGRAGSNGTEIYIRVPLQDGDAVVAALTSWAGARSGAVQGFRIRGRSAWLVGLLADGREGGKALFR